jgi:4-carboxymuconolactone decarboxylase
MMYPEEGVMIPLLSFDEAGKRSKEVGIEGLMTRINVSRLLMHNPTLTRALSNLLGTLMTQQKIPARIRELMILRTAWLTGGEYVFCRHVLVARELKIPEQEILGVRDPDKCPSYSAVDRAAIALAGELSHGDQVSPNTWAVLEKTFAPEELLELLVTAGNWRMFAIMFKAAKLPLDPELPGWPEGRRPAN